MTLSRPWFLLAVLMIAAPVAATGRLRRRLEGGPHEGGPHEGGPHARPPAAIEFLAGHAGFADDATIEHSVFGGAGRVYVTPRLSVGPEITYMRGPREDRDWFFLGNLTFDILRPRAGRPRTVSPVPDRRRRVLHAQRSVSVGDLPIIRRRVRRRRRHTRPRHRPRLRHGRFPDWLGSALSDHGWDRSLDVIARATD